MALTEVKQVNTEDVCVYSVKTIMNDVVSISCTSIHATAVGTGYDYSFEISEADQIVGKVPRENVLYIINEKYSSVSTGDTSKSSLGMLFANNTEKVVRIKLKTEETLRLAHCSEFVVERITPGESGLDKYDYIFFDEEGYVLARIPRMNVMYVAT